MSAANGVRRRVLGLLEENRQGLSITEMQQVLKLNVPEQQQVEAGRPVTVIAALRICEAFHVALGHLVTGLDRGIYQGEGGELINGADTGWSRHETRPR